MSVTLEEVCNIRRLASYQSLVAGWVLDFEWWKMTSQIALLLWEKCVKAIPARLLLGHIN